MVNLLRGFGYELWRRALLLVVLGIGTAGCGHPGGGGADAATDDVSAGVAPVIVEHPSSVAVEACGVVTLGVEARGTEPLSYQWYRDGAPLLWGRGPSIGVDTNPSDDGAAYSVRVTNDFGEAQSRQHVGRS